MNNFLFTIFSAICGENPEHLWSPGGQCLPCCQRCTGFYIGALVAIGLQFLFRPLITRRFLVIHVFFLLQLGLFVFPWIPQSPVLRNSSGTLFGFGVVFFLWETVSQKSQRRVSGDQTGYWTGLALSVVLISAVAQNSNVVSAYLLTGLIIFGGIALGILSFINLVQLFAGNQLAAKTQKEKRQE